MLLNDSLNQCIGFFFYHYSFNAIKLPLYQNLSIQAVIGGKASCMKDYLNDCEPYLKDSHNFPKFQVCICNYYQNIWQSTHD